MSKAINPEKAIKSNSLKETKCPCQPLPNWVKWLVVILVITIFVIVCVQLHYLWKLSDIWNAVKNIK